MGIYDRDYYRREGGGFLASFSTQGQVCKWLILSNVLLFILQLTTRTTASAAGAGWVTEALWLDVDAVAHGQVWRLLTYAFLHDFGWAHIVFNMLFLWWFGHEVETIYGPKEFLAFYLVSAFLGGLVFFLWALPDANSARYCLGASGAVTAVMVLFALHYPGRVIYLWFILPVPVWLLVAFQVGQDAFYFVSDIKTTTAVTVHLAGAAFGFVYHKWQFRLMNLWPSSIRLGRLFRSRPRLRVYREEENTPTPVSVAAPAGDVDEQLEAKVDAVLEKVLRTGQDSLTDSERQVLLRASEKYKNKRRP